jgi:hypothetical protein
MGERPWNDFPQNAVDVGTSKILSIGSLTNLEGRPEHPDRQERLRATADTLRMACQP